MAEIVRSGTPTPDDDDVPEDLQKRSIAADDRHSSSSSPKYSVKNPSKKTDEKLEIDETEKNTEKRGSTFTGSPRSTKKLKVNENLKKCARNLEETTSHSSKSRSSSVKRNSTRRSNTPESSRFERPQHSKSVDRSCDGSRKRRNKSVEKRGQLNDGSRQLNDSRDRHDNSRNRRDRSRDRPESSRNHHDSKRDNRDSSRDRRDSSRDRLDSSRNHHDSKRDYRDSSRDRRDSSRNRRDRSRNRRDRSRDHRDTSRNRHNTSRNHRDNSMNNRDSSRDRRDSSRDRRDSSRDRRDNNRNNRDRSRNRRDNSMNNRDSSRDRRDSSRDCRDSSRDRRDNNRNNRDRSRNRRDNSRNHRDSSRDRRDSSRNHHDSKRDHRDISRDRRNSSRDRYDSYRNRCNEKHSRDKAEDGVDKACSGKNDTSKEHDSGSEQKSNKKEENKRISERQNRTVDLLTSRTGGAYIPPAKLRLMQAEITDKSSMAYQRIAWEALKKSIHGYINKVNVDNIGIITRELIKENLIRGRGLLCRSIVQAQAASPTFTHVYAALVAIINSKFPKVGELLVKRLIIQFKRAFRRGDKTVCLSSGRFIAHLVNQRVVHEILALEMLTLMVEEPTDDSVEVAIGFLRECGMKLTEVTSKGIGAIFDMLRNILHEGKLDKRVQYMIEVIFQVRKDGFKDNQSVIESLELIEEDEQFTHLLMLDDANNPEDALNAFKFDKDYEEIENKYKNLSNEILGSDGSDSSSSDDSTGSDDEDSSDDEETKNGNSMDIIDNTEKNLTALRRTIYLTINSSLDFEECAHKLMKMKFNPGEEVELCHMFLDCCAEQRTYEKFYGLLAQRFCAMKKIYVEPFEMIFRDTYDTTHRLDTNRLRNVSKFFAHLLFTDAISWDVLDCIKLNEDDTTSSSRIFIKILFQELAEYMGLAKLNKKLKDEAITDSLVGLFPRDNPRNTRFSINFFTSIGLGGLTDDLRQFLKSIPKSVPAINAEILATEPPKEASSSPLSSSSSSSSTSSSSSSTSSSSSSESSSSESSASAEEDSSSDDSEIDKHLRKIKLKSKRHHHLRKEHHKKEKLRKKEASSRKKRDKDEKDRGRSRNKANIRKSSEHNKSSRRRRSESPLSSSSASTRDGGNQFSGSSKRLRVDKTRMKSVEKQYSDRKRDHRERGHKDYNREKIKAVEEDKENRKKLSKGQEYSDDDRRNKKRKREFDRNRNSDDNHDYDSNAKAKTKSSDVRNRDKSERTVRNLEENVKDQRRSREIEKQHERNKRGDNKRHDSQRRKRHSRDDRSRSREKRSRNSERTYKSDRKFEERSDEKKRHRYK